MKKARQTNNFDSWFSANYQQVKERVVSTNLFGEIYNVTSEDVFHDSYLICREIASGNDEKVFLSLLVYFSYSIPHVTYSVIAFSHLTCIEFIQRG